MSIKNVLLGGTDWVNGDILYAVDQNDTFDAVANRFIIRNAWVPAIYDPLGGVPRSVLAHSSSTWVVGNDAGVGRRTTNSGSTWASCTGTMLPYAVRCAGTAGYALSFDTSAGVLNYTVDSGANWTVGGTPAAATGVKCCSFPTSTKAVIGATGAARTIFYSNNNGVAWTLCTTGPTASVVAIAMWNGSTGYAVDTSNNIWKTTDGGANWTDTTYNTAGSGLTSLICVSSTVVLYVQANTGLMQRYIDATSVTNIQQVSGTTDSTPSNFVIGTNGYVYLATFIMSAIGAAANAKLLRSKDLGLTWQHRAFPAYICTAPPNSGQTRLTEYTTNKFIVVDSSGSYEGNLLFFDEAGE